MSRTPLFDQPSFVVPIDSPHQLAGQQIGVTGARGVLGRILVDRLSSSDVSVSVFEGDVRNADQIESWVRRQPFDLLFHFAAVVSTHQVSAEPLRAFTTNGLSPALVAATALASNSECWFFAASTSHVYRTHPASSLMTLAEESPTFPTSFYGLTKLMGEHNLSPLVDELKAPICIGRVFSFSHISQEPPFLVPTLRNRIDQLAEGGVLRVTNTTAVRDILDAETVVDCVLHLATRRYVGLLNIGSGEGMTVERIARRVSEHLDRSITIQSAGEDTADSIVADVTRLREVLARPT